MKQSHFASIIETLGGTALGFAISYVIQMGICWYYDLALSHGENFLIIGVFTIASLIRGYVWRRVMEAFHVRRPLSPFMQAVIAERYRQIEAEGFSVSHDDAHDHGELSSAAAAYCLSARWQIAQGVAPHAIEAPHFWPWSKEWWKPQGFRRDLVRAGALLIAEGDRFERLRKIRQHPVAGGYQPKTGERPPLPTTGSGVCA